MTQVMKKMPAVLLAGMIAVAFAFAIGAFTAQEAYADEVELSGSGTDQDPYKISNYDELKKFATIVNDGQYGAYAILTKDIYCTDKKWVPIGSVGSYNGTFNGDHKTIHNLSNEDVGADKDCQGLFGAIHRGEVKNVGVVGGKIIGKDHVGAVVGQIGGKITNCYNTGAVSGNSVVGGLAGNLDDQPGTRSTITNCYNTGAVSGNSAVGGLAGVNFRSTITNSYNTGAISGNIIVGGVAGYSSGKITNCYFDNTFSVVFNAIGDGPTGETVKDLATDQMIGRTALDDGNMAFSYTGSEQNPWIVKANGRDEKSGAYYLYYPHLKGFNLDGDGNQMEAEKIDAADWPAKLITATEWSSEASSYPYTASPQGPTVTKVTISQKPVKVPEDKTGLYSRKTGSGWEALSAAPTDPGSYKLTIKDGDEVIDELVFVILDPATDYTVTYQVQKETDGGGTGWTDIGSSNPVDAGKYKAAVTYTDGSVLAEKEFQIKKAKLTITAISYRLPYNGEIQGPGDASYDDTAEIAKVVEVKGLQGADELTSVEVDGQGQMPGPYPLIPNAAAVNKDGTGTDNYDIDYVNGTLTIEKVKPEITTAPKASAITYGQTLAGSSLSDGAAKGADGIGLSGRFEWDNTDTTPAVSDSNKTKYDVTFTPDDEKYYDTAKTTVTVTVNKADLTVTAKDQTFTYNGRIQGPGGRTYNNAAQIAEAVDVKGLQGTDALTSVVIGGQGQDVGEYKLIPSAAKVNKNGSGTGNYKISYVNGTLTIEKPKPKITTAPKASAITYGETLKDSGLTGGVCKNGDTVVPGTFKWSKPDTAPAVSDSNRTKYDVTFTPSDATYGTLATKVTLTVNKADIYPTVSINDWIYGSAANTPAVEGNPGGGEVTFLYKGVDDPDSKFSDKVPTDAGTYVVKAEVAETANYNAGEAMLEFTISPAEMQVTSAGYSGLYDGAAHSITVNAPDGADIEYSKDGGKTYSTENPAYTDAGEHEVMFRVRIANYNEYTGSEYVLIDQAPNQVTVAITEWTYGKPAHIPTVTAKFGADKAKLSYSYKPDGTYTTDCPDQAGIWYVRATVPGTKNYAGGVSKPVAFEIAKAAVTIMAEDKSTKRGESLAELTYKIRGEYVEGDNLGVKLSTDADRDVPGDYTIKVSWNKNPNYDAILKNGTYIVTSGKIEPAEAKIELDAEIMGISSGGTLTAKWGSVDGADSYDVYFTYCGRDQFQKVTVSGDTTSLDITKIAGKKLNKKRNYKYYVVAYTTLGGEKVQLAKSIKAHVAGTKNKKRTNVKAIKVKKTSYTLKVGKKAKIKAKLVLQKKHKKILTHEKKFRYATSDPAVATVSKGKIKAVGAGTCDIYVYAINGCAKKLTVTVQ